MNISCFISADPAARNATRLYDGNVDSGDLWFRDDLSAPLPTCSTFSPATSQCTVCVKDIVHAVCRNLPEGVMMMMEGVGVNVSITKDGCPEPPPVGHPRERTGIFISIFLFFFLMAAVLFQCWRSKKRRRNRPSSEPDEERQPQQQTLFSNRNDLTNGNLSS